jgi:hypothetical protein
MTVTFPNSLNMLDDNKENWQVSLFLHLDQDYTAMKYRM